MNMEEYNRILQAYVSTKDLNLGDGESVLTLLYEAYAEYKSTDTPGSCKAVPRSACRENTGHSR